MLFHLELGQQLGRYFLRHMIVEDRFVQRVGCGRAGWTQALGQRGQRRAGIMAQCLSRRRPRQSGRTPYDEFSSDRMRSSQGLPPTSPSTRRDIVEAGGSLYSGNLLFLILESRGSGDY